MELQCFVLVCTDNGPWRREYPERRGVFLNKCRLRWVIFILCTFAQIIQPPTLFGNVFFFSHWKCQINTVKCQITPNMCDDHDCISQWGNLQVSPGPVRPVCHRAPIAEDHREQSTTRISDGHDATMMMMMIPDAKPASWLVKVTINCADCICFIWQPNTLRGSSSYLISLLSYFFPLLLQVQNKHVFFHKNNSHKVFHSGVRSFHHLSNKRFGSSADWNLPTHSSLLWHGSK